MHTRTLTLLVLLSSTVAAFAQAPQAQPRMGVSFSVANAESDLSLRYLPSRRTAILGTIGYSHGYPSAFVTTGSSSNAESWTLGAGVRRYISADSLRPFVEVSGLYHTVDVPQCKSFGFPSALAGGGVEYFVAQRVSIEGSAGLQYASFSERCKSGSTEYRFGYHALSTMRTAISITFYF